MSARRSPTRRSWPASPTSGSIWSNRGRATAPGGSRETRPSGSPAAGLQRRIAERADRMLAAGLVDEVRCVLARGVAPQAPGLDGVGYREVVAMLEGRLPPSALRDAIVTATRAYAKRQETWFRHQLR